MKTDANNQKLSGFGLLPLKKLHPPKLKRRKTAQEKFHDWVCNQTKLKEVDSDVNNNFDVHR